MHILSQYTDDRKISCINLIMHTTLKNINGIKRHVAHVVRFLTSPLSGFILGEIIDINGGLHMD